MKSFTNQEISTGLYTRPDTKGPETVKKRNINSCIDRRVSCRQTAPLDLKRTAIIIIIIIAVLSDSSVRFRSRFLDDDEIRPVVNSRFNNRTGEVFLPWLSTGVLAGGFDGLLDPVEGGVLRLLSTGSGSGTSAVLSAGLRSGRGCDCGCGCLVLSLRGDLGYTELSGYNSQVIATMNDPLRMACFGVLFPTVFVA